LLKLIKRKFYYLISDKKFSEILTGSAWALVAKVGATLLGLVLSIVVARFYGAEMVGVVAITQSFLSLAIIISVMGTHTAILRLIPEHIARHSPTSAFLVYRKTQCLVIVASLFSGFFLFSFSNFIASRLFSNPSLSVYISLASIFIVFKSLMIFNTHALRSLHLIRVFAFMNVLPNISNLTLLTLLTFFLFSKGNPVYTLLASFAITGVVGLLIMEHAFKRKISVNDQIQPMSVREILTISLPMLMTTTMSFVIGQTGVIILGIFRTEAEVGYFAIAVKLATLTSFIIGAINTIAGPKFSELYHSGKTGELFYVAKKSAKLVFWTTAPILLILIVLGKSIIGFLYGGPFTVAFPAMILIVFGQFVNGIAGTTSMFMNMTGRQIAYRNIIILAALINVILNLILIPNFGITGAAISALNSISFLNIASLVYIKLHFGKTIGYFPILSKSFTFCSNDNR
jgi:O-antigen/teichoic acid export membrane protein